MQEFADGKGGWDATTVSGDKDIIIRSASRIVGEYIPKVNSAIIDSKPGKPTRHQICEAFDNAPKRLSLLNATAKVP